MASRVRDVFAGLLTYDMHYLSLEEDYFRISTP